MAVDRRKQAEEAKKRVLSGSYTNPTTASPGYTSGRAANVKRFYETQGMRDQYTNAREEAMQRSINSENDRILKSKIPNELKDRSLGINSGLSDLTTDYPSASRGPNGGRTGPFSGGFNTQQEADDSASRMMSRYYQQMQAEKANPPAPPAPKRYWGQGFQEFTNEVNSALTFGVGGWLQDSQNEEAKRLAEIAQNSANPSTQRAGNNLMQRTQSYDYYTPQFRDSGAGIAANIIGSLVPGQAAFDIAGLATRGIVNNLGRTAARGALGGAIYQTGNEAVDAARTGEVNPLQRGVRIGISAGLGGAADAGLSALGRGIQKAFPNAPNPLVDYPLPGQGGITSSADLNAARRVPGRPAPAPGQTEAPYVPSNFADEAINTQGPNFIGNTDNAVDRLRSRAAGSAASENMPDIDPTSPQWQRLIDDAIAGRNTPEAPAANPFGDYLRNNKVKPQAAANRSPVPAENVPGAGRNAPETVVDPSSPMKREVRDGLVFGSLDETVPSGPAVPGAGRNAPEPMPVQQMPAGAGRNAPELPAGDMRERGVVTSLSEQDKIPQEMTDLLRQNPNSRYEPITNADTLDKANLRVAEDISKARNYVDDPNKPFDAEKAITAQRLIDHYNSIGDYKSAASVADRLATEATRAGQFIQAQSLRDRLTPDGVLQSLKNRIDYINENLPKNAKKRELDEDTEANLMQLAYTAQKAQGTKNNANGVLEMIQNKKPGEKLTDSEISQIEVLLNDNRAFVKDATRRVRNTDSPAVRQPRDKRVQAALNDFFDRAEQAARDRINARKGTLSSTPFDVWADWIIIGMSKMGKGTVKFADWSEEMVRDLGENVRPTLNSLFDRSKQAYDVAGKGIRAGTARKTKVSNEEFKSIQDNMVVQVRTLLDDTKTGTFTDDQLQAIRDTAEELVDAMPPANRSVPDAQKAYEQAVKSLANKLAGVEKTTVPVEESIQEVRRLLQTVSKATATPKPKVSRGLTESQNRIDEAGYALAGKARPDGDALSMELNAYSKRANELIEKAKAGNATVAEMQEAVRVSEQIMKSIPEPQRMQLDEAKQMQQLAKSLVRTLQAPPGSKAPRSQAVQDMQRLLQTAQRLKGERTAPIQREDVSQDAERLNDLARGLMERTKYKPLAPEEKAIRGFIRSKGDALSAEQIDSLQRLAEGVTLLSGKERIRASQELQIITQSIEKPGLLRKISAAQTISQLLNPKTQIRNIVGNEMFYRVERLNKLVATPIDIARSKLTGTDRVVTFRTNNQENFWLTWMTGGLKKAIESNHFTRGFVEGGSAGARGVNVNGLETQFELQGQAFRGKYNPLTYMEKALGASLRSFDNASYTRAYNNTMGELATLDAINKGIKPTREYVESYARNAGKNIQQLADDYGRYVTFQDNNVFSTTLVGLKRMMNAKQDFGFGDLVLKYPKTPGALLMRALEYSPAGLARSAYFLRRANKFAEEGATRKFVESLSRATVGTIGFAGMGYVLMDAGILTTASSRDKDIRTLEQGAGKGAYQVNLSGLSRFVQSGFDPKAVGGFQKGDKLYTYDWAQPVSLSLSIGSEFKKNQTEGKTADKIIEGIGGVALNSFAGSFNTLTEQSVLRGLKDAAQGYPGQTVTDKVISILFDLPSSFIPTALNQVRQVQDNTARETYDPNSVTQSLNKAKNKIPGLAQGLPPRFDNLGNPGKNYQDPSLFNIFLSPGKASTYNPDEVAQGILDLITETDDDTLAPRVPQKKLGGIPLTGEQFSELSRLQGLENRERLGKINRDKSTSSQVKKTERQIDKAAKYAKKDFLRAFPDLKADIKANKK